MIDNQDELLASQLTLPKGYGNGGGANNKWGSGKGKKVAVVVIVLLVIIIAAAVYANQTKAPETQLVSNFPSSSDQSSEYSGSGSISSGSRCPDGYPRSPSGNCEIVTDTRGMPRCQNGYHRSPDGDCEYVG